MAKRIVVALGGNAILTSDPTAQAQSMALNKTAEQLMPLIKDNDVEMVVTHGMDRKLVIYFCNNLKVIQLKIRQCHLIQLLL